jgi:uncharacterized SAM-binding protein YcdF (DUF218 family)
MKKALWSSAGVGIALLIVYVGWISTLIRKQATQEEARSADVILVLGAAEYRGRPSPVLKARLDHALDLYARHLAPRIMTTGGAGGDPVFTESTVGRMYLMNHGVPSEMIIVEKESDSTVYTISAAAEIMLRMGLKSTIVVSDGYHIWRVKKMLMARGIAAWGSPRPEKQRQAFKEQWYALRQAVGYLLWSVGISV